MKYNFHITICPSFIDNDHDDNWHDVSVELSLEEFVRLDWAYKYWLGSEASEKWDSAEDLEIVLIDYVPDIHKKVRKAISEQAPIIYGESVIPYLSQIDIYLPDEIPVSYNTMKAGDCYLNKYNGHMHLFRIQEVYEDYCIAEQLDVYDNFTIYHDKVDPSFTKIECGSIRISSALFEQFLSMKRN